MSKCKEIKNLEGDSLTKRYEPLVSHLYTSLSSSSFLKQDPSMKGIFGQGEFSKGGGDYGNKEDPLWVYPIETVDFRDIVEERGLEEVPVLLENLALC